MNIQQLATVVSESIAAVGVIALGIGYLWGQVFIGRNQATKGDYDLLLTRLDGLQKTCDAQQKELADLHRQVGELNGVNLEKEKRISELTNLLQNRDPALLEYMSYARTSIEEFKKDFRNQDAKNLIIESKLNQLLTDSKIV